MSNKMQQIYTLCVLWIVSQLSGAGLLKVQLHRLNSSHNLFVFVTLSLTFWTIAKVTLTSLQ